MRAALALLAAAAAAACPAPDVPSADDTAAYLGLAAGATTTFEAGALSETHEVATSSILSTESGLVFDHIAKQNGFLTNDRTFSIELLVESARLVRLYDCVVECGTLDRPIELFAVPLDPGSSTQTEVVVTESDAGTVTGTVTERHTLVVGDEAPITVPAGSFTGIGVSWTRERPDLGETDTALLTIVPGTGVVAWDGFDGAQLRRR